MIESLPLLKFSRVLATFYGIILPVGETARRWGRIDYLPAYLDDWLIAAFLLYGAWATARRRVNALGVAILAGAWGFACGMGYASFFGHLQVIDQPDPGRFPQVWLTSVIGVGWLGAIAALGATLVEARRHAQIPTAA